MVESSEQKYEELPFSPLQRLRHSFLPKGPASIRDVENTKVKFERKSLPISDGIKQLFPTLTS
jgi:hypothetical protein